MSEYELMCKDSPIQKEWNPKGSDLVLEEVHDFDIIRYNEDNTATVELKGKKNVVKNCSMPQYYEKWEFHKYFTWLPRQEDWQELYMNKYFYFRHVFNIQNTVTLDMFFLFNAFVNERIDDRTKPFRTSSMVEWWCLFVHKEVYGLTWDWEEKKWELKK